MYVTLCNCSIFTSCKWSMTAIPWCLYHGYHCLVQLFIWCYFCGSKRRVWIRKTSLDTYRILYRYLHSLSCMSSHEMQLFQSLEIPWIFAGWPIARARTPSGVRNRDGDRVVFQELRQRQRLTQQRMEEKCKEQKAKTQDAPGPLCFSMFFFMWCMGDLGRCMVLRICCSINCM